VSDLSDALELAEYERNQVKAGYHGRAGLGQVHVVALADEVVRLRQRNDELENRLEWWQDWQRRLRKAAGD
jgi:hypothetical protein